MTGGTLLWLVAVAVVALVAAVALRRVSHLAGGTHELERLQADVVAINGRLAEVVDPLVGHLDEVRRGARDPASTSEEVEAARSALRAMSRKAHELRPPAALRARSDELAWEVDRAVRAADMAGHGLAQMGNRRHEAGTEAQTALKRGTLGLRHAREAVTRLMIGVAKLTPAEVHAMPIEPVGGRFGAIATPSVEEDLLGEVEDA